MAKRSIAKRRTSTPDERIFEQLRKAPALLTEASTRVIEGQIVGNGPLGVNRRMAFTLLSRSGAELIELAQKNRADAVALADAAQCIDDCAKKTRQIADLIAVAATRAHLALCVREDMDSIIKEAANG